MVECISGVERFTESMFQIIKLLKDKRFEFLGGPNHFKCQTNYQNNISRHGLWVGAPWHAPLKE